MLTFCALRKHLLVFIQRKKAVSALFKIQDYDKSIQNNQQSSTGWPPDNKPLNCTPNWQAGKPIHSRADAET